MLFRALISLGVVAADTTLLYDGKAITGKSLEEVYGPVEPVESMFPYHLRPQTHEVPDQPIRFDDEYYLHRTPEMCDFPIELAVLQDTTDSFDDDITNMIHTQVQQMIDTLSTTHPGSAFAVVDFKDKPIWPLGGPDDYCLKFGASMTTDPAVIKDVYSKILVYGGGDPPEAQFHALVAAAQSRTPGWGTIPTATRLIVVATDAAPHFEGDGFNAFNLPPFSGTFEESSAATQCTTQYYPSPDTVRKSILQRQAYLGALVYDGSYDHSLPIDSWKWFNSFLGQTDGFVHDIQEDSSNFWERLALIIRELEQYECGPETTPDPVATTKPPVDPECPPCPEPCPPTGCDPCCREGVLIKLEKRPKRLHLEVEN